MAVEKTQLAIVGASAAGLAAGLAAARGGAEVLLLEAKAQIGEPAAPAIVSFDFLWPGEIERPAHAVRRRLAGARMRGPDGRGPSLDAPLALFDRARLDRHLAAEAEKAGARVVTGVRGLEARPDGTLAADGLEVRADVLLFADGVATQARRYLRPTRDPASLAWGAVLELDASGDADELLLTFGPHAPGGRSQLNALAPGRWSHWTFFRGDPADAEQLARRALALDARLQGWDAPEARFAGVAPDPVYTIPGQLVAKNVLVAGGAAGQGGLEMGLASGWMAGDTAARALRGEARLRDYERAWRRRYQKGYRRLRRATDLLAQLSERETRALFGAWDGARLTPALGPGVLLRRPRGALALAWAAWLAQART